MRCGRAGNQLWFFRAGCRCGAAVVTFLVIFGGVKSIANVCEKLVPFMSLFYTLGCFYILFYNRAYLIPAIELIVQAAFTPRAMAGGFIGSTIMTACRYGCARGLFSNESGMGSAPIVAAAAQSRNPVRQALIASTGTFWDTVVVCLITGLVLVSSILANPAISTVGLEGGTLTTLCFAQILSSVRVIDLWHSDVCLFDHFRLELLRRTVHGVSVWQKGA